MSAASRVVRSALLSGFRYEVFIQRNSFKKTLVVYFGITILRSALLQVSLDKNMGLNGCVGD